jgi:hypothetical protein
VSRRVALRHGRVTELSDHEHEICAALGPGLREYGLFFVGIDGNLAAASDRNNQ